MTSCGPNWHKYAKGFPENYVLSEVINKLTLNEPAKRQMHF